MPARGEAFDVAIIGAGVNGAGIARDAALRGLRVVVFDQSDICSGTSAWSSRLIHGGLRYLEYGELPLVYESLRERRRLQRIAPHLVRPLRLTIPIYENGRRGPWLIRLGMLAYDVLSLRKELPSHDMLSRRELLDELPALSGEGLRAGARYYDAQVTYAERLVLENALAARAAGASIRTWHRVTNMPIDGGRIQRIAWHDVRDDRHGESTAEVVINAAGPWVDDVIATATDDADPLIGGTKGSHIIVGRFDGAPTDALYVEASADGRPFFIIPWNRQMLIGTTDIRYDGKLDSVRASGDEIRYLLDETNRVFPQAKLDAGNIHYTYSGVRPLPQRDKGPESAITRKHIIRVDKALAANLVSIIGGKLTTYRSLAQQAVDRVGRLLSRRLPPCRTHDTPLPGGWGIGDAKRALEADPGISPACAERLLAVYGSRSLALLAASDDRRTLDADERVLASEVSFAVREELARSLVDIVFRRMMVGLDADQGRPMYAAIAELAATAADWSAAERNREHDDLEAWSDSLLPPR